MSYYILAHRRKRIEDLDLGNVFNIGIIGVSSGPVGLLVEHDPEEDKLGVQVVGVNEQGEVVVSTGVDAIDAGDISIRGEQITDQDITGNSDD